MILKLGFITFKLNNCNVDMLLVLVYNNRSYRKICSHQLFVLQLAVATFCSFVIPQITSIVKYSLNQNWKKIKIKKNINITLCFKLEEQSEIADLRQGMPYLTCSVKFPSGELIFGLFWHMTRECSINAPISQCKWKGKIICVSAPWIEST